MVVLGSTSLGSWCDHLAFSRVIPISSKVQKYIHVHSLSSALVWRLLSWQNLHQLYGAGIRVLRYWHQMNDIQWKMSTIISPLYLGLAVKAVTDVRFFRHCVKQTIQFQGVNASVLCWSEIRQRLRKVKVCISHRQTDRQTQRTWRESVSKNLPVEHLSKWVLEMDFRRLQTILCYCNPMFSTCKCISKHSLISQWSHSSSSFSINLCLVLSHTSAPSKRIADNWNTPAALTEEMWPIAYIQLWIKYQIQYRWRTSSQGYQTESVLLFTLKIWEALLPKMVHLSWTVFTTMFFESLSSKMFVNAQFS